MTEEFNFWEDIDNCLDEQFPKGKCKERGNALVLNAIFHLKFGEFVISLENDIEDCVTIKMKDVPESMTGIDLTWLDKEIKKIADRLRNKLRERGRKI
jgi:hypothetical protein